MSASPPPEVRQCPTCQRPAVVMVMEWQHTHGSLATGEVTREYRCQDCGAWQVKKPRSRTIAFWIVGGLMTLTTCLGGLPFLFLAWRDGQFDKRVPLVPGVPVPAIRFPGGPPKRTCGKCGGIARATNITRHTHRGVPTGETYDYQCGQCPVKFTTQNALGTFTSSLGVLTLAAVTAGIFFGATHPGWKWGGGLTMGALTLFLLWELSQNTLARFTHPALTESKTLQR